MLLGLIRPDRAARHRAARSAGAGRSPRPSGRIGRSSREPAFYPYLSGRDNLRVLAPTRRRRRATGSPTCSSVVELADRARDRFSTYSLGMKQRLGVAAALLKDPDAADPRRADQRPRPRRPRATCATLIRGLGPRTARPSSCPATSSPRCSRSATGSASSPAGRLVADGTVAELRGQGAPLVAADPLDDVHYVPSGCSVAIAWSRATACSRSTPDRRMRPP